MFNKFYTLESMFSQSWSVQIPYLLYSEAQIHDLNGYLFLIYASQSLLLFAGKGVYNPIHVKNIMREIYTKGSVTASFNAFSDFLSYKSGKLVSRIKL